MGRAPRRWPPARGDGGLAAAAVGDVVGRRTAARTSRETRRRRSSLTSTQDSACELSEPELIVGGDAALMRRARAACWGLWGGSGGWVFFLGIDCAGVSMLLRAFGADSNPTIRQRARRCST